MLGMYADLALLLMALLFWHLACSFAKTLRLKSDCYADGMAVAATIVQVSEGRHSWIQVGKQFKVLQGLSARLSICFGTLVTLFLLEFVFYYAIALDEFFLYRKEDWEKIIISVFWLVEASSVLYFAADACQQVLF